MTDREALFQKLQAVVGGHKVRDGLGAAADLLAALIGFSSTDLAGAERFIDTLPADLKRTVRENWPATRAARAAAKMPEARS